MNDEDLELLKLYGITFNDVPSPTPFPNPTPTPNQGECACCTTTTTTTTYCCCPTETGTACGQKEDGTPCCCCGYGYAPCGENCSCEPSGSDRSTCGGTSTTTFAPSTTIAPTTTLGPCYGCGVSTWTKAYGVWTNTAPCTGSPSIAGYTCQDYPDPDYFYPYAQNGDVVNLTCFCVLFGTTIQPEVSTTSTTEPPCFLSQDPNNSLCYICSLQQYENSINVFSQDEFCNQCSSTLTQYNTACCEIGHAYGYLMQQEENGCSSCTAFQNCWPSSNSQIFTDFTTCNDLTQVMNITSCTATTETPTTTTTEVSTTTTETPTTTTIIETSTTTTTF